MAKENQTGDNSVQNPIQGAVQNNVQSNVENTVQNNFTRRVKGEGISILRDDILGAGEWKRSKVGWLLGVTPFIRVGRSAVKMVSEPFNLTLRLGRKFFSAATADPLPTEASDPMERFSVAKKYYNRTDSDINLDTTVTSKWFSIYFVITALLLGYCMVAFFNVGRTNMPWWGEVITDFALLPCAFAFAAQMGFQNWQLRTARLGSFREYALTPSVWLAEPGSDGKSGGGSSGSIRKSNRGVSRLAMAVMVTASLSSGAWIAVSPAGAQSPQPTTGGITQAVSSVLATPGPQDIWVTILTYIFPNTGPFGKPREGLISEQEVQQVKAIQGAFSTFLACLMALSSAALAYFTLVGTISTAHEGKVMGQRWHTFYAPVRVVAGFSMLVPVVNGYCMAQLLVLYIAVWGGSLGNAIWSGYVDTLGVRQVSPKLDTVELNLLYNILSLEGCRQTSLTNTRNAEVFPNPTTSAQVLRSTRTSLSVQVPNEVEKFEQARNDVSVMVTNHLPTLMGGTIGTVQAYQMSFGNCGVVDVNSTSSGDQVFITYDESVRKATEDYLKAIKPYVKKHVAKLDVALNGQTTTEPDITVLTDAINNFNNSINEKRADLFNSINADSGKANMETIRKNMKGWGWASAGTFYMSMSNLYNSYAAIAARMPSASPGLIMKKYATDTSNIPSVKYVEAYLTLAWNEALPEFVKKSTNPDIAATAVAMSRMNLSAVNGEQKFEDVLQAPMLREALGILQLDLSKGSGLDHMVTFGHSVLRVWSIIVGLLVGVSAFGFIGSIAVGAAFGAPGGPVGMIASSVATGIISGVMGTLSGIIQMLLILILSVGIVHAYIFPMIPYIMMTFFLIGMLVLVVEGVVAAPLWAFFHIRPDGQEFVEQVQKPGYMILFNLLLRVPLALFGMFFSFLLIDAMMWFESKTFIPAFLSISTNDGYGIFGILAAIGMVGFLHYQICIRSFGLITHLPDHVSRWFGQAGERMDEGSHTDKLVGGIIGRAESKITTLGGGAALGGAGRGPKPGKNAQAPKDPPPPKGGGKAVAGAAAG